MQISLEMVREEPFTWQEQLAILPDRLDVPDVVELGSVTVEGRIEFFDPDFHLQIRYGYRQQLQCSRCLKAIDLDVEGKIDGLVKVSDSEEESGEVQLDAADLGLFEVESDELDSEPILKDELQLNVPMKPLCQPDCKGLCGGCGADLNREDCRCETAPIDPRWQALATLKLRSDDDN